MHLFWPRAGVVVEAFSAEHRRTLVSEETGCVQTLEEQRKGGCGWAACFSSIVSVNQVVVLNMAVKQSQNIVALKK